MRRLPDKETVLEPHNVHGNVANMLRDYALAQQDEFYSSLWEILF